ncbi:MAG TPA: glucose 1-dehydrogenase [Candidatus Krumholzibacteria bacterium]|nr:glucose 1-dehydrogenase [Candidatus Krumholzibacteria bacterium]
MKLDNKVAIVTGAGSGIGREVAYRLARAGAKVVVSDIAEAGGQETTKHITDDGGAAHFVKADASKPGDHERLVGETVSRFGALHVAVNNAGVGGPSAPTGEYPLDGWDKVIAINLSGVFYGMRYQIPAIKAAGGGNIVNIASILGQVAFRNAPAYVAAKHGVVGLTKNAAVEYAEQNIRLNVVGPGFIRTHLLDTMDEKTLAAIAAMHPMNRLGTPAEVADLVVWLASDQASFVTGAYFAVDGGYLAQ